MYKTSWMHPRSNHWHLIDCVIITRRDLHEVQITRAMRGAECPLINAYPFNIIANCLTTCSWSEWKLHLRGQITYRHCRQPKLPKFLYSSNHLFGGRAAPTFCFSVPTTSKLTTLTVESLWTAPTKTAKHLILAIDETSWQQQQSPNHRQKPMRKVNVRVTHNQNIIDELHNATAQSLPRVPDYYVKVYIKPYCGVAGSFLSPTRCIPIDSWQIGERTSRLDRWQCHWHPFSYPW